MSKSVVDIELTASNIQALADNQIINKPMRPRTVSNIGIKLKADNFDVLDALVQAMVESGNSADDIKAAVSKKLEGYK